MNCVPDGTRGARDPLGGRLLTAATQPLAVEGTPVRELRRDDLLQFLYGKVGRWDTVWWNGELISLGEALGKANELLPSEHALCSRDEVLVPDELEPGPKQASASAAVSDTHHYDRL
jgi:hypothetical protein